MRRMPNRLPFLARIAVFLLAALTSAHAWSAAPAAPVALVTIQNGAATALRDENKLAVVEGAAILPGDILELTPQALLLKLEFNDGAGLLMGPGSRVLISPRLAGDRSGARVYVLAGWAKLSAPPNVTFKLTSAQADLQGSGASAVLGQGTNGVQVFAENGEWQLKHAGAPTLPLKRGDFAVLASGAARFDASGRPTPQFLQSLPRAFMDTLPSRAAMFQGKSVTLKALGPVTYADAKDWIDAEPALRRAEISRWRALARDEEVRQTLIADLKNHPEWEPVLFPSAPKPK